MFDLAEVISNWIFALRITTWQQWLLRGGMVAAGAVAAWVSLPWVTLTILPVWVALVAVGLLWSAIRPDSTAPLFALVPYVMAWSGGGADSEWWRYATVVAGLLVFHATATFAAAAPTYADVRLARGLLPPEPELRVQVSSAVGPTPGLGPLVDRPS
ncbi:MAG TPA: hypothetical protein K8V15_05900 [Tessaracoccus flavescens]|uniref:Uncharacterized protein n=1 Tax=Tessaracoccus flavescens TaxID=399497 RepID=A0A921EMW9_9ACTN|nr:hypothetical protein [Tessaracoccus flavescens]